MGSYTAIKGQTLTIDLLEDSRDNGWVISGNKAIHSGCNAGVIELKVANYTVGVPNKFQYAVSGFVSGTVQLRVGATNGAVRSANGTYEDIITPVTNDKVRFYSNGELTLEFFAISPVQGEGESNGVTFGFYEKDNKWGGNFSYLPETMVRFTSGFFSFKNGELWKHNTNELRNNFYGEQFNSQISFYVNLNPDEVKLFHTMRQNASKVWSATDIEIAPYFGKPTGQKSRLKKGRFKSLNGQFLADFLRNMEDSRFSTNLEALMKGGLLQGKVMKITLQNDDTVEVRMVSVDVILSKSDYTF